MRGLRETSGIKIDVNIKKSVLVKKNYSLAVI